MFAQPDPRAGILQWTFWVGQSLCLAAINNSASFCATVGQTILMIEKGTEEETEDQDSY